MKTQVMTSPPLRGSSATIVALFSMAATLAVEHRRRLAAAIGAILHHHRGRRIGMAIALFYSRSSERKTTMT
ncbi:MAG: hypothetical protein ACLU1W_04860 [Collinsella sp.]